jgi:two-component system, chemotaxis family, protein-glutamate methylesterase/glutaminase
MSKPTRDAAGASRQAPWRVLIVDDSAFMRASLRHIVSNAPGFTVVGEANDGQAALEAIRLHRPHIVTLDIDMPNMDGIGVLKRLRPRAGTTPVFIMVSAFTTAGASMTLAALEAGAIDFVPKASEHFKVDLAQVGEMLREKLAVAATVAGGRPSPQVIPQVVPQVAAPQTVAKLNNASPPKPDPAPDAAPSPPVEPARPEASRPETPSAEAKPPPTLRRPTMVGPPDLVVVAASTGGPQTLPEFLRPMLPFNAPVVIAQHIPPVFSLSLAQSLAAALGATVVEAEDGQELAVGVIYVLPGGQNAEIVRRRPDGLALRSVSGGAAIYRPNADILFRSAALNARRPVGAVLTGMGADGCEGARALAQRGCPVLAQDPATAVVWGMPRTVIDAGLASFVADPVALGRRLAEMAAGGGDRP